MLEDFTLIENESQFADYKDKMYIDDRVELPKEYPCFAYTQVFDWPCQLEETKYLYAGDLDLMLGCLIESN